MRSRSDTLPDQFSAMKASWNMTQPSRLRRQRMVPRQGVSADYHFRNQGELFYSMELARDLERNEPLLSQGLRRLISNLKIGRLFPDPETGDPDIDKLLIEKWVEWSTDKNKCHAARELDWTGICNVAFRRLVVDGDVFGLLIKDTGSERYQSVQTLEAHRCRDSSKARADKQKRGVCGVQRDGNGVRQTYWFTREPVGVMDAVKVTDLAGVAAYDSDGDQNVLHAFNPTRFSQTRGFTHIAPVFDHIAMRDDIDFATLVKHQVASCIGAIEEVDVELWEFFKQQGMSEEELKSYTFSNGTTADTMTLRPGGFYRPKPGHKLTAFNPNLPVPGYFEHIKLLLQYLALNLDLPLIVLLLDASDTTFSSYRHVLQQARETFSDVYSWFASAWHRPTWIWLVREWAQEDEVLARFVAKNGLDQLRKHKWSPPVHEYIEPVKDATGDMLRLGNGLTSPRRYAQSRLSCDWSQLFTEIITDRSAAIRLARQVAADINSDGFGDPISWRDLLPMPELKTSLALSDKLDPPAAAPAPSEAA